MINMAAIRHLVMKMRGSSYFHKRNKWVPVDELGSAELKGNHDSR